jgi:hypothetical protein
MATVETLKYLDAHRVDTPAGRLDGAVLVSPTHELVGRLDGVLIDPSQRKVRYYVVQSRFVAEGRSRISSRHYLLPLTAARLDRDHRTLEIDLEADDIERLDEVDLDRLPQFDEGDLMTALFAARAS